MKFQLYTDGGSRGNPGHAAWGFVVYSGAGIILEKSGNYLGITTNNQAEYEGLIAGLSWITSQNFTDLELEIFMDSLLIVNQVKGVYKMKNAGLRPKLQEVRGLLSKLTSYSISYVPRAKNSLADSLVNLALDQHLN